MTNSFRFGHFFYQFKKISLHIGIIFSSQLLANSAWNPICWKSVLWCRVDVSLTDVSPTESSWMLHSLNKASLGNCAPDQCVPTRFIEDQYFLRCMIRLLLPPPPPLPSASCLSFSVFLSSGFSWNHPSWYLPWFYLSIIWTFLFLPSWLAKDRLEYCLYEKFQNYNM